MFICPNLQSTATTIAVQRTTKQECQHQTVSRLQLLDSQLPTN